MKVLEFDHAAIPVKAWVDGVEFDANAIRQVANTASLPFVFKHVAVMPDVHYGRGATVGTVVATKGAIIPAAVGVDIGCGMGAVRLSLTAEQLPGSLAAMRTAIEKMVPLEAKNGHGERVPNRVVSAFRELGEELEELDRSTSFSVRDWHRPLRQLGTLGSGNHFIEVCLDEEERVWVMLHSGSRGIGNDIGMHFTRQAERYCKDASVSLPDRDLAYLPADSPGFGEYCAAVGWAQKYAMQNRKVMMGLVLEAIRGLLPKLRIASDVEVWCHHNYMALETHFGEPVWVTRKGAVRAQAGELGIIPGSMGAKSYIVRGKGNPESFMSCSHGAGRRLSRGEARQRITLKDHRQATEGVECRKDQGVIDESPAAYKDIDAVMAAQTDLVETVHTLKQVLCVKG
jgi:tRNA-splicing ligase RtcB